MNSQQKRDSLQVEIFSSREEMGRKAAADIEQAVCSVIETKGSAQLIFAAAPSQNNVLAALCGSQKIDWKRVHAFHMDEYVGIDPQASQGFAKFLRDALFSIVNPGTVEYLDGLADPLAEADRYSALLRRYPADIVVMGIGENGHIAFNDPHVADFNDKELVKPVILDEECRLQQVHDGCFQTLSEVPKTALTLTIPALMAAKQAFCIVPAATKAKAVAAALNGPVAETCPASILRRHPRAVLYLDADSSGLLREA